MSNIILTMQISLDGVVSDIEQWMTFGDDVVEDQLSFYDTLDAIMVGGNSYPGLAAYWQQAETASESALERRFAKKINEIEKIVLSRSDVDLVWKNSRQLPAHDRASLVREVEALKNDDRRNISVESGVGCSYRTTFSMHYGCGFIPSWSDRVKSSLPRPNPRSPCS